MNTIIRYVAYMIIILFVSTMSVTAFGAPIILARGDEVNITIGNSPASVWLFGDTSSSHIYDMPAIPMHKIRYETDGVNTTETPYVEYIYTINNSISNTLSIDRYTILLQRNGVNTIKEISYLNKPDSIGRPHDYLTSPYKNIQDVELGARQQSMVRDLFLNMIKTNSDDEIDELQLNVEEPAMIITDISQINNTAVYIEGTTNLQNGTRVAIVWDEDKTAKESTWVANTFYTVATSNEPSQPRIFSKTFPADIQHLMPGKIWITATANNITSRVYVTRYETFDSNITMRSIKYLDAGIIVTPTPITITKIVEVPVTVTKIVTVLIPTQPFPVNALGETYDPTKIPDISNFAGIPLVLGIAAWILLTRRGV